MSASKGSRFGKLPVKVPTSPTPAEDTSSAVAVQEKRELLGAAVNSDLKSAIKQASAREKRKIYQLTEDALTDYLKRHHPDLLKD